MFLVSRYTLNLNIFINPQGRGIFLKSSNEIPLVSLCIITISPPESIILS